MLEFEYINCNFCGCGDARIVFRKNIPVFKSDFNIVKCRRCGLVYLNPRVAPSCIASMYNSDYFLSRGFHQSSSAHQQDAEILARCIKYAMLNPGLSKPRLLDIGSYYYGFFASAAGRIGFDAEVVDISEYASALVREKGVKSIHGEISDTSFDSRLGSYDVITAMEVVEHCYDPMAFFKRVFDLLKPDGIFIYTTGNFHQTRLKGDKWAYFNEIPYHVYFFTPRTIKKYFEQVGFGKYLDPYRYIYNNRDLAVRLLSKIGIVDIEKDIVPVSFVSKVAYSYVFKSIAAIIGKKRLPFAVKH
jgi:2-polyprenyl-3-methyl-5-hydroxy-6-metoxy-1,4-benzoquinol methylase